MSESFQNHLRRYMSEEKRIHTYSDHSFRTHNRLFAFEETFLRDGQYRVRVYMLTPGFANTISVRPLKIEQYLQHKDAEQHTKVACLFNMSIFI